MKTSVKGTSVGHGTMATETFAEDKSELAADKPWWEAIWGVRWVFDMRRWRARRMRGVMVVRARTEVHVRTHQPAPAAWDAGTETRTAIARQAGDTGRA